MVEVFFAVPLFVLAVLLTGLVRELAAHTQLLAMPSSRGLHSSPTPVGGGVAIVLTYMVALVYIATDSRMLASEVAMLGAGLPVAIAGFLDDRAHLSVTFRLSIQAACAFFAISVAGEIPPILIGDVTFGGFMFVWVVLPFALIWLTNLYNFMDGIDGIAGVEASFVSLAASMILLFNGDLELGLLCLGLFSGATGFLVWNWPPARIFMGDVGSGFLGLTLAIMALLGHVHGSMSLWSWLILLSCFIVDASVTLLRRMVSGQTWHEAHRQHAFQHAALQFGSHKKVTVAVLLINVLWLFPLACFASLRPEYGVYFAAIGIVPLVAVAHRLGAGKEFQ